jgi:hypothetical protein
MRKTVLAALVICGIAVAYIRAVAGATENLPDKYVKLVHVATDRVLSIADNSEADEAKAVIAKDDDSQSSHWRIEKDGDYIKLINRKSGKVLDVQDHSKDQWGQIVQWEDKPDDNDNQRWSWEPEAKDGDAKASTKPNAEPIANPKPRRLKSKSSGLILDIGGDYTVVQKKADKGSAIQTWTVVEVKN